MEGIKALLFDCYGTLIDWEQGMFENLQPIFDQKTCPEREKVFSSLGKAENRIQNENKSMLYPEVLARAYKQTTADFRLAYDEDAALAFGDSVGNWPAFPDSAEALARLSKAGLKLIILSNVHRAGFDGSRKKLETNTKFDAVYVAEEIGSYKPDLRNFQYALEHLSRDFGIEPQEVMSVANSRLHDIQPASKVGIKTTWINRANAIMGVKGYEGPEPNYTFETMSEFADEIDRIKGI